MKSKYGPEARPAAFLDRDGVINMDVGYAYRPGQIVWIDGAPEAIRHLNENGYWVFVVTNQAGLSRGLYNENDVDLLHLWMATELSERGARIDDFRFSPYHPEFDDGRYYHLAGWRKPEPGMLLDLMAHWPVRREGSFLVGDRESDIEAARRAGVPGYLFTSGNLLVRIREVLPDLAER